MYVVITKAEIVQYASRFEGGIDSIFSWVGGYPDAESRGISQSELDAFEYCVPERDAREMGILSPRGEDWIWHAVESDDRGPIPKAMLPDRPLPEKGKPVQLQLVPIPANLDDPPYSYMEHEA